MFHSFRISLLLLVLNKRKIGWQLGRQSATLSFAAPIQKFVNHVYEVVMGQAPHTGAFIRSNQRVVPMLSYASRLAVPPSGLNLESSAHRSVHSVLKRPSYTFPRQVTNSIASCSGVRSLPINPYCVPVMDRFAVSGDNYLSNSKESAFAFVGDNAAAVCLANVIPHGGIDSPIILQSLRDSLGLKRRMHLVYKQVELTFCMHGS